jgi:hypothetical protein
MSEGKPAATTFPLHWVLAALQAKDVQSGELLAVKVYNLNALGELNKVQLIREIRLHGSFVHRNIIELYVAFQVSQDCCCVMQHDGAIGQHVIGSAAASAGHGINVFRWQNHCLCDRLPAACSVLVALLD